MSPSTNLTIKFWNSNELYKFKWHVSWLNFKCIQMLKWAENTEKKTEIIYYVLTKPHSILLHDMVTEYGHFRPVSLAH